MDIEIAKEKLKVIDIKFFLNGMIEQSNYIVDKADEINIAIETVLSELEKKEKEILRLKNLLKENEIYKKNLFDYAEKKEKIIELMARYLDEEDVTEIFCEGKEEKECISDCTECIIEYFTNKVEREGK